MAVALRQYRELRDRVDRAGGRLVDMHCKHIACRPGCHDCCTDLAVSAAEYRAILEDLRAAGVTADSLPFDPNAACAFLSGGLCTLYRFRPIICRTHGLPIAFTSDSDDDDEPWPEVSVSFCPKNFIEADPQALDFGPDNTLDLDALNAELAEINRRHAEEVGGAGVRADRRMPLSRLRDDLAAPRG